MTVSDDEQRVLHRLIYRALPQMGCQVSKLSQHVLKFEMELSRPPSASTEVTHCPEIFPTLQDLVSSDEPNSGTETRSSQANVSQPDSLPKQWNNGRGPICRVGRETHVNLMLPDRSVCHPWLIDCLKFCHLAQWICSFVLSIGMALLWYSSHKSSGNTSIAFVICSLTFRYRCCEQAFS